MLAALIRSELRQIHPVFAAAVRGPADVVAEFTEPSFPAFIRLPTDFIEPANEPIPLAVDVAKLWRRYRRKNWKSDDSDSLSSVVDKINLSFPLLIDQQFVDGLTRYAPFSDIGDPLGGGVVVVPGRLIGIGTVVAVVVGRPLKAWPHIVAVVVPIVPNDGLLRLGGDRLSSNVGNNEYVVRYVDVSKKTYCNKSGKVCYADFSTVNVRYLIGQTTTVDELACATIDYSVLDDRLLACTAVENHKKRQQRRETVAVNRKRAAQKQAERAVWMNWKKQRKS